MTNAELIAEWQRACGEDELANIHPLIRAGNALAAALEQASIPTITCEGSTVPPSGTYIHESEVADLRAKLEQAEKEKPLMESLKKLAVAAMHEHKELESLKAKLAEVEAELTDAEDINELKAAILIEIGDIVEYKGSCEGLAAAVRSRLSSLSPVPCSDRMPEVGQRVLAHFLDWDEWVDVVWVGDGWRDNDGAIWSIINVDRWRLPLLEGK